MEFSNKKVAVLGFGLEGAGVADLLIEKQANVSVFDEKKESEFDKDKIEFLKSKNVEFNFGKFPDNFDTFDIIIRSPGVKPSLPQIQEAIKKGENVTSPIKIFFSLCPGKIVGVTGTKGKGTTATLIYEMFKKQGYDAYLAGNIGSSPLDFIGKLTKDSWIVLEQSSFQLIDLDISPHIAVMLMVTSEHLDYHADVKEYVQAKRNILAHQTPQDFAILNRDYPASNESDIYTEGKVFKVSRERRVMEDGCFVQGDDIVLKLNGKEEVLMQKKDVYLPGEHNLENVCAAALAGKAAGVLNENIVIVLKTFKGLPHRLELVAEVDGVRYYDDSFSTTPETAIAAIKAFVSPKVLILGGSSKGSDFSELGGLISESKGIRGIVGIGVEWTRIKEKIYNKDIEIVEGAKSMDEIVNVAKGMAKPGDVVLLTPACASFDMFKNYKDRGDQFKKKVKGLLERK